ncbi:hypothetical protein HNQ93_000825 [Hymenobacter luteus]|uniref:Roadblock/LAMTOR2 domain-containing protein n=2 Tax=Hymenobacter TaxID=89966 RepID=A0A7W9WB40_9BACT|nr:MULTISPECIES: hypothetical protein [Hymenobacter]MBB4599695.1 hypothetical protein [Hymenobacter latericoloratus]MBB6057995.1 hypothetical protein [Hymenobacter luteus]
MQLPFLNRLQGLTGPVVNKIVSPGAAGPEQTAAELILQHVLAGLPELVAAAVVLEDSGQALATYTTAREFNVGKVIGYNADVIRQQRLALKALQLPAEEQLEEVLITLRTQLHLLRLLPDGRRFLYVVVDCRDTNLGIAREVMRTCEG